MVQKVFLLLLTESLARTKSKSRNTMVLDAQDKNVEINWNEFAASINSLSHVKTPTPHPLCPLERQMERKHERHTTSQRGYKAECGKKNSSKGSPLWSSQLMSVSEEGHPTCKQHRSRIKHSRQKKKKKWGRSAPRRSFGALAAGRGKVSDSGYSMCPSQNEEEYSFYCKGKHRLLSYSAFNNSKGSGGQQRTH